MALLYSNALYPWAQRSFDVVGAMPSRLLVRADLLRVVMDTVDGLEPDRLWRAAEVLTRPSPIPAASGVYGWHFEQSPDPRLPAGQLLYVGTAPRRMAIRISRQNLRTRVRYHFRGNAEGPTLRLTLGCLLGLELRRVGSERRLTFGQADEKELTTWMADTAWGVTG
ncbi:GIY-YIG nuclease family protein [Nonomuraea dietziae]|uniref:GIY-YIG nuclease family protein n=1 Tax=Nonomuraea dietziae TaxID=65515 RepID=UPI0033DA5141